jgi:hypothetical protein
MSEANWMMQELHPATFQTTTIPDSPYGIYSCHS